MSGGRFEYCDSRLASEIYGYGIYCEYDLGNDENEKNRAVVRKQNRFEDKEISELVYDVLCLIHSYDWYASGDTGKDDYRKDVKYFKDKWFGKSKEERVKTVVNNALAELKSNIYETFNITE